MGCHGPALLLLGMLFWLASTPRVCGGATNCSCPPSALPGARLDVGRAKPWSSEEEGESQMQVFLTGSSGRTETARVSFPHATRGGGAEKRHPRSSVRHRTKNRMSTTSKMAKRTIIAHHCRRSGRKRKSQSPCVNTEGKPGESFSSPYR